MALGIKRQELRKVRSIATLIGKDNLLNVSDSPYLLAGQLHVYSRRDEEENELQLSIWDEPKDKETSKCLFADRIKINAFHAALDYWGINR
ncbi:MAG: hypothetical protein ACRDF4_09460 [Rhabdochlamydiaceae bacterium]